MWYCNECTQFHYCKIKLFEVPIEATLKCQLMDRPCCRSGLRNVYGCFDAFYTFPINLLKSTVLATGKQVPATEQAATFPKPPFMMKTHGIWLLN